ncbi:coiled-coil domain-containing protein 42 homolog isoform X2 [Clinocottus analis]|uniref:coiled-coil domain-containing protein 42 homolog isoform X2 n=1 Tax=Clinocottus analis TaxID=304258 RepID=UPI0035BF0A4F
MWGPFQSLQWIFASLQQRSEEFQVKIKKQRIEHFSNMFLKEQETDQAAEKAQKERKEVLCLDAKLESLKLEHAKVMGRKQTKQRQIQRHSAYQDLLERTVRMTKFNDVQDLTDHIENLLYFQDHFCEREDKAHEHVDQLKKSLLTLQDNHHLQQLQDNYQLSKLQAKMEKTRCETVSLERKWNLIEETAAKKTLFLGKIKIATFNLYEMANEIEADKPVDMNETYKQLDKVKMFIQTYGGLVKQHATATQKLDEQEKEKTKHIAKSAPLNN